MNKELKEIKNSTLLAELKRRLKLQEIRFNHSYCGNCGDSCTGLISFNSLDPYELDFDEIEKMEEQRWNKFSKDLDKRRKELINKNNHEQ